MYEATIVDGYIAITGYPDGSDWILDNWGRAGIAGPNGSMLWQLSPEGLLATYDIAERRQIGEAALPLVEAAAVLVPARDRNALYVVSKIVTDAPSAGQPKTVEAAVVVIDLDQLKITRQSVSPAGAFDNDVMTLPDGAILVAGEGRRADARGEPQSGSVHTRIDPETGSFAESYVPYASVPDSYARTRWLAHSPDGRWWLRFDHTHFPVVEHSGGAGQPTRFWYGLTLQLWSSFPLRFERRIVVAWLKAEDLPDETKIYRPWENRAPAPPPPPPPPPPAPSSMLRVFGRKGVQAAPSSPPATAGDPMLESVPARDRVWRAVSQGLHQPDRDPDAAFPDRQDFGADVVADDALWEAVTKNLDSLVRRSFQLVGWQPDGDALWLDMKGFLICAGVDGGVSPRLWSERFGLRKGMMVPFANAPQVFGILPGRRLQAGEPPRAQIASLEAKEGGAFVIDGSPAHEAFEPVMIPSGSDGWQPGAAGLPEAARAQQHIEATIRQLREDRSIVRVRLDSLDPVGRSAAIARLAGMFDAAFPSRAVDSTIDIGFAFGAEVISEKAFFDAIGPADRDWAVPALRALIARFVAVVPAGRTLYQPDGDGLLGQAVHRLVILDPEALPLVQGYGALMDGGHEYHFPNTIVPAVLDAQGWNPATLDFMLWVLVFNFYNSFDEPTTIWHDLGLAEALQPFEPVSIAQHLVRTLGPKVAAGDLDWQALSHLRRRLGDRATPWDVAFFAEIERLVPGAIAEPDA